MTAGLSPCSGTWSFRSVACLTQIEKQEQHLLDPTDCSQAADHGRLQIGTGGSASILVMEGACRRG